MPRKADVRQCLVKLGQKLGFRVSVHEVDIERSSADDLSDEGLWAEIHKQVSQGEYDVAMLSPPCNTYSRARMQWKNSPGPRPVRNATYPWGFPWLGSSNKALVRTRNFFIRKTLELCGHLHFCKLFFLIDHPEDLGIVGQDRPASIWQLPETRSLAQDTGAYTWAIHQCEFGASTTKPTRFLSNISKAAEQRHQGWPQFDIEFHYISPLPRQCSRKFHVKKLIGKDKTGKWATSPAAAYPPGLCKRLALILASVLRKGGSEDEFSAGQGVGKSSEFDACKNGDSSQQQSLGQSVASEFDACKNGDSSQQRSLGQSVGTHSSGPSSSDVGVDQIQNFVEQEEALKAGALAAQCRSDPITVEWDGESRHFIDGFGMCSPNRWRPELRGARLPQQAVSLLEGFHSDLRTFVEQKLGSNVRRAAFELEVGQIKASPFSDESLEALRVKMASRLPMPGQAVLRADGQPFYLEFISQAMEIIGDPDWGMLVGPGDTFSSGVRVGYKEQIQRAPKVFPPKVKSRALDQSIFSEEASNYKSAEEFAEKLESKFREDESRGWMFPTTAGVVKSQFPDSTLLIAAMGAIPKPDGSVRPIHDGTHFAQVNNNIKIEDQLQHPGPHDAVGVIREVVETRDSLFTISADIASAHRLVKIRKRDWPLLGCRARADSKTIWLNCVGTFGSSSAPYYWSRLFGLVGRLVSFMMLRAFTLQIIYVDDMHIATVGQDKFTRLWMLLVAYEMLGAPFSYKKFRGGLSAEFVGYFLDYREVAVGIVVRRGTWLSDFIGEMSQSGFTVSMRLFAEFLGRLGFVARVLTWLKPFLAPLYSWSAALDGGTVATAPKLVRVVLVFITRGNSTAGSSPFPAGGLLWLQRSCSARTQNASPPR